MDLTAYTLAVMLAEAQNPELVTTLLDRLAEEKPKASELTPLKLNNGGSGGLQHFKKLPAPLAEKVAEASNDQAVLEWIAAKERRLGVREHLGNNPHLPDSIVQGILSQEDHPSRTDHFLAKHLPVEELLKTHVTHCCDWRRILAEFTPQELFDLAGETTMRRTVLPVFMADGLPLHLVIEFASLFPTHWNRYRTLDWVINQPGDTNGELWDLETWEPVFQWEQEVSKGPERALMPDSYKQAPLEWVKTVIRRSGSKNLRRLAVSVAPPEAIADTELHQQLSADELWQLHSVRHAPLGRGLKPQKGRALSFRVIADQALKEQDTEVARNLVDTFDTDFIVELDASYCEALLRLASSDLKVSLVPECLAAISGRAGTPTPGLLEFTREAVANCYPEDSNNFRAVTDLDVPWEDIPVESREVLIELADLLPFTTVSYYNRLENGHGPVRFCVRSFEHRFPTADESDCALFLSLLETWEGPIGGLMDTLEATS